MYRSLTLFTNFSFLTCLAVIKSFAKNDGLWYFRWFQNVSSFISISSVIISFINYCSNFDLGLLCLVGLVARSVTASCIGLRVEILFKSFIGSNLVLKLLKTFSLALNNNSKLF